MGMQSTGFIAGSANKNGALSLMDHVLMWAGYEIMQVPNEGVIDYGFTEMEGLTQETADYKVFWRDYNFNRKSAAEESPYFDLEYYRECLDYWDGIPTRLAWHWMYTLVEPPGWRMLVDDPPATSVAAYNELLQQRVDNYNNTHIFGR
jgi:hypothetical protein